MTFAGAIDAEDGRRRSVLRTRLSAYARKWTPQRIAILAVSIAISSLVTTSMRAIEPPPSLVSLPLGDSPDVSAAMAARFRAGSDTCLSAREVGYSYDAVGLRREGGGVKFLSQPRIEERDPAASTVYQLDARGRRVRVTRSRCVVVRFIDAEYETRAERFCGADAHCVQAHLEAAAR